MRKKSMFKFKALVEQSSVALLYKDGVFQRELKPGKYTFHHFFNKPKWRVTYLDTRERSLIIKNQEILTKDKVAVRVSIIVYFRVESVKDAVHNVSSYEERIYEDVQLAARRFLAGETLDNILDSRNKISESVKQEVKNAASSYGVNIVRADVKDLVFPGNLREIMNQVLETQRKAEAELIIARKEAETIRIKTKAENEADRLKNEALKESVKIKAEAERQLTSIKLQSETEEAELVKKHPNILKIRKIKALSDISKNGGKFIVGLKNAIIEDVLKD